MTYFDFYIFIPILSFCLAIIVLIAKPKTAIWRDYLYKNKTLFVVLFLVLTITSSLFIVGDTFSTVWIINSSMLVFNLIVFYFYVFKIDEIQRNTTRWSNLTDVLIYLTEFLTTAYAVTAFLNTINLPGATKSFIGYCFFFVSLESPMCLFTTTVSYLPSFHMFTSLFSKKYQFLPNGKHMTANVLQDYLMGLVLIEFKRIKDEHPSSVIKTSIRKRCVRLFVNAKCALSVTIDNSNSGMYKFCVITEDTYSIVEQKIGYRSVIPKDFSSAIRKELKKHAVNI